MSSLSFQLLLLTPLVAAFGTAHFKGSRATALDSKAIDPNDGGADPSTLITIPLDAQLLQTKKAASLATNGTADSLVYSGVTNSIGMFEVHAPSQGGKAPATGAKSDQPVGVQVEEKVMDELQKDLSPACSKRYSAMMKGEGPEMHSFNQHGAKDNKGKQCEKELQGSECSTLARMTESQQVPDGRKMTAKTKVEGMSCLPKECTEAKDLAVLASFMHGQTKEIFPDERIKVALHVDCSAAGGAVVDANGGEPEVQGAPKSGAAALVSAAPLLALLFA